jgi:PIN domain nuclease of toxin-antitoxin system
VTLLLDTHVLLWWFDNPDILSDKAHNAIADGENLVFISAAVAWEIAIKKALGKLEAPDDLEDMMVEENFQPLPITIPHALAVATLPPIHQDPFDRMQIAQANAENLTLVSRDAVIRQYKVPLIVA